MNTSDLSHIAWKDALNSVRPRKSKFVLLG